MFISVLDLLKIGIGPSSSHTMGPMVAANHFRSTVIPIIEQHSSKYLATNNSTPPKLSLRCILKGSLAYTGIGHATDRAVVLGLHGYLPDQLTDIAIDELMAALWQQSTVEVDVSGVPTPLSFTPDTDIIFDKGIPLPEHPNGMIFQLIDHSDTATPDGNILCEETYFSIGGGFINTLAEINQLEAPIKTTQLDQVPYPFSSAKEMLTVCTETGLSIAALKRANEEYSHGREKLNHSMDKIWNAMSCCVERGLASEGTLPGGLNVQRRAKTLYKQALSNPKTSDNDWLCAYAMAVNEENAAGHMVVTAPTNGAAGVLPAVLYLYHHHYSDSSDQIHDFLLTAAAIGGLIKHKSSISGAEVGCQGEVGSAASMAAAGLCAIKGGSPKQIENAAEIALEHHMGMTCDPVAGLVQVPCIERNSFGAIKATVAADLALKGTGEHFMPLDSCIEAMKQTGYEMSEKFKETSLGGLAVSITEC